MADEGGWLSSFEARGSAGPPRGPRPPPNNDAADAEAVKNFFFGTSRDGTDPVHVSFFPAATVSRLAVLARFVANNGFLPVSRINNNAAELLLPIICPELLNSPCA